MQITPKRATRDATPTTLALWREYHYTGDAAVRDRIVFAFTPMVCHIVDRNAAHIPVQRDVDDFLSRGLEALIDAIECYDEDGGTTLEQFAWTRVYDALLDELRRSRL
jgi:RNA polymerase sigma factor FliA